MPVTLEATRLAPARRLFEMHAGDVAHLEKIADIHVFGGHETPDRRIRHFVARDVDVRIARVPAFGGQIGIALEGDGRLRGLIFFHLDLAAPGLELGAARRDQLVGADRHRPSYQPST